MENNLIKNEVKVFYTIEPSEGVFVSEATFYGGKVDKVELTRKAHAVKKFTIEETAIKVVGYTNGKLIQHTQTEIITDVTREVKLEGEN